MALLLKNVVYAGILGPTKMTSGLMGMIGGWHYPKAQLQQRNSMPLAAQLILQGYRSACLKQPDYG